MDYPHFDNLNTADTDFFGLTVYAVGMAGVEYYEHEYDKRFMLSRDCRSPLWRQIAVVLEREIIQGRYIPGDRLPPEGELAHWFGVNRHTVRRALSLLQDQALVKSEQGRGTFVHMGVVDYQVSRRTRFSENLNRQNKSPRGVLIKDTLMEVDDEISEALQIPPTHLVTELTILREGDGHALSLSTHYFPMPRFAGIAETFKESGSVTNCLHAHGVADFFREETRVVARAPSTKETKLLGLPKNKPILETRSINVDEYGVPVDYGVACYAGEKVQLVIKTPEPPR